MESKYRRFGRVWKYRGVGHRTKRVDAAIGQQNRRQMRYEHGLNKRDGPGTKHCEETPRDQ